jgi:hypothetical protein
MVWTTRPVRTAAHAMALVAKAMSIPVPLGVRFPLSVRRPMIGVAIAPTRRFTVSSHWAVLTVTSNECAMVGMRSSSRKLVTAM